MGGRSPVDGPLLDAVEVSAMGTPVFVVGTEAADAINVTVQLKNGEGVDLAERGVCDWYLATDALGDVLASTAPTGGIAIGTDGTLLESVANLSGIVISEADGDIDVTLTDVGTPTFHLVIVTPNGRRFVSSAITFA